ncbi:Rab5 [Hexamita inflata]|uniref:Rab5 n=1 Tax=Hexamita inflata TaxID=28002 RepID=A0ABP1HGD1_9EUKA
MNANNESRFKLLIEGASGTHKSRLLYGLIQNSIAVFGKVNVQYQDQIVKMDIWRSQRNVSNTIKFPPHFYKMTSVVLLVFDVGKLESLRMCPIYIQQIRSECSKNVQIMLIGQQFSENRQVSVDEATVFAEMNKMTYAEVNYVGDQKESRSLSGQNFILNESTQKQMIPLRQRIAALLIQSEQK